MGPPPPPPVFWNGGGGQDREKGRHLTAKYDYGGTGGIHIFGDSSSQLGGEGKGAHVPTCSNAEHFTFH